MSTDKQFYLWPSNNNCSILDISTPSFYSIVMFDDNTITYEIFEEIVNSVFPKDKTKTTPLFSALKDKGNIVFSQYVKDVVETKILEITTFSMKNNFKIDVAIKKNITNQ